MDLCEIGTNGTNIYDAQRTNLDLGETFHIWNVWNTSTSVQLSAPYQEDS